jgi:hypothetical protein
MSSSGRRTWLRACKNSKTVPPSAYLQYPALEHALQHILGERVHDDATTGPNRTTSRCQTHAFGEFSSARSAKPASQAFERGQQESNQVQQLPWPPGRPREGCWKGSTAHFSSGLGTRHAHPPSPTSLGREGGRAGHAHLRAAGGAPRPNSRFSPKHIQVQQFNPKVNKLESESRPPHSITIISALSCCTTRTENKIAPPTTTSSPTTKTTTTTTTSCGPHVGYRPHVGSRPHAGCWPHAGYMEAASQLWATCWLADQNSKNLWLLLSSCGLITQMYSHTLR